MWFPIIRFQNLSDLKYDSSRSLKVKCDGAFGLSIYDFLLMSNSIPVSISHRLSAINT